MSRKESKVDTKYSSGDSHMMSPCRTVQNEKSCKEENNNDINIDELSQKVNEMGCIMDGIKRPPNICVETYVYKSDSEKSDHGNGDVDEANYSDEFEDDKSDEETETARKDEKNADCVDVEKISKLHIKDLSPAPSTVKLSKSQSFTSSKASVTGKSSNFGSISSSRSRRINMSFTNDRLREIERQNQLLLSKIMRARHCKKSSIPPPAEADPRRPPPPAALFRKKQQQKIDHENMILLKKLQSAKSSEYSIRR